MNEANPSDDIDGAPCRPPYPDDFKRDAVRLVTEEKYRRRCAPNSQPWTGLTTMGAALR